MMGDKDILVPKTEKQSCSHDPLLFILGGGGFWVAKRQ